MLIFALVISLCGVIYYGWIHVDEVNAEDATKQYTVYRMQKLGNELYIPEDTFQIDWDVLSGYLICCWWEADWELGDLFLKFEVGEDEIWMIRIMGNDSTIEMIRTLVDRFDTKCKLPGKEP